MFTILLSTETVSKPTITFLQHYKNLFIFGTINMTYFEIQSSTESIGV